MERAEKSSPPPVAIAAKTPPEYSGIAYHLLIKKSSFSVIIGARIKSSFRPRNIALGVKKWGKRLILSVGIIPYGNIWHTSYWEVIARQQRRYPGPWGMGIGTLSMFLSSFSVTLLALLLVTRVEPWYQPQYLSSPARHAALQHHERHRYRPGQPHPSRLGRSRTDRGPTAARRGLGHRPPISAATHCVPASSPSSTPWAPLALSACRE